MTRRFAAGPSCRYDGGHSELFRYRLGTVGFARLKCSLFGPDLSSFPMLHEVRKESKKEWEFYAGQLTLRSSESPRCGGLRTSGRLELVSCCMLCSLREDAPERNTP